jgi:hypothetical protein
MPRALGGVTLASQRREKEAEKANISEQVDVLPSRLSGSQEEFERQKMTVGLHYQRSM